MQPTYKYYIRYNDSGTLKYYRVLSGSVTTSTAAIPLPQAPKNWDDVQREWERGFTYYGIFTKFTGQLQFVNEGAHILRHVYFTQGIEGKAELVIKKFDNSLQPFDYVDDYVGDIDFSRLNITKDFVSVEVTQGGFVAKLTARENTPYEIQLRDNPNKVWVKMHEYQLQFRMKWFASAGEDFFNYMSLYAQTPEGTNLYLDTFDQLFTLPLPQPFECIVKNKANNPSVTFNMTCDYNFFLSLPPLFGVNPPFQFRLFYAIRETSTGTAISAQTIHNSAATLVAGSSYTFVGTDTQSITLAPDRQLEVIIEIRNSVNSNIASGYNLTTLGCTIAMDLDFEAPVSYFPTLRLGDCFAEQMEAISDGEVAYTSSLLNTTHYNKVISSGDGVRNLAKSILKINFADYFKFLNCTLGVALKYFESTNVVYLESKESVYQNNLIADLGEFTALEITPWAAEMFSNLKTGYNDYTYDEVNGKDEFNSLTTWLAPVLRVPGEKDYVSQIRTDSIGAVLVALNLTGKDVTDAETDNDPFAFHIETASSGVIPAGYDGEGEPYYNLYRETIPPFDIQNVYSPASVFNLDWSPRRCIERSKAWFASLLHNLGTQYLKLQSKSKSNYTATKMITDDGSGNIVDEGADILISDLGDPMFYPVMFKATIKNPVDIDALMAADPYGYFSGTWKGQTIYGHPVKVIDNGAHRKKQEITMLCTNFTNLSNLVY